MNTQPTYNAYGTHGKIKGGSNNWTLTFMLRDIFYVLIYKDN